MTQQITTEMLLHCGCEIDGVFAFDVTGNVCVARRPTYSTEHHWVRWINYAGKAPKFRARVKATSQPKGQE